MSPDPAAAVLVTAALGEHVATLTAKLRADPSAGIVRPGVSTILKHNVRGTSRFTQYGVDFEFDSDEASSRGGGGAAPSPLRYLLSGVAFCLQGWCAKTWSLSGVPLTELTVTVRTLMDMRGELLIDDVPAHPQWFVVDVQARSAAADAVALALVAEALRRCPLTSLVSAAVPLYLLLTHNGILVVDERPAELNTEHEQEQTR